jgi:hypothetical protein
MYHVLSPYCPHLTNCAKPQFPSVTRKLNPLPARASYTSHFLPILQKGAAYLIKLGGETKKKWFITLKMICVLLQIKRFFKLILLPFKIMNGYIKIILPSQV